MTRVLLANRHVLRVAAIAVVVFCTEACPSRGYADLHAAQPLVDIGEVRSGAPLSHRFFFMNPGPAPVEIVDVHTSCGCLKPHLSKRALGPGEEGSLLLEINTLSPAAGPQSWHVHLAYRSANAEKELELRIVGKVISEITVQPASLTVFTDAAVRHEITLTDLRARPLHITAARGSADGIQAQVGQSAVDRDGHWVARVEVMIADGRADGRYEEQLSLYTDDREYPELRVPITIVKQSRPRVTANPNPVTFAITPGQPIASRVLVVRDRTGEKVALEKVLCDNPAVACRCAEGPGAAATVKLAVDHRRLNGAPFSGTVTIHLAGAEHTVLTVPLESSSDAGTAP